MTEPVRTLTPGERSARALESINLALVGLALVVTHLVEGFGPFFSGVLAGGLLGALNLRGMTWLTHRLIAAEVGSRARYSVLFAIKLALLGSVIWVLLSALPIDIIGFLVGFSTIFPAAMWLAISRGLDRADSRQGAHAASQPVSGRTVSKYSTQQEHRS